MTLDHNPEFQHAFKLMEDTQQTLFITGKAGTGKSTLLDYFCQTTEKNVVVLAPTGVAALNVKGQTVHRFFNFYIDVTPEKIRQKDVLPRDPKLYKTLKTLIIDEVSMLRADLLDCIDAFLRLYGPVPMTPFGGVQMVFVGDLYQLPPVVGKHEKEIFHTLYGTPYFFSAHCLEDIPFEVIELETVYRQRDKPFVTLLNKIRNNTVDEQDLTTLNQRYSPAFKEAHDDQFTIHLTTTNQKAEETNEACLEALKTPLQSHQAMIKGDFGKEYFPTAVDLHYKIGAQVMMLNNDAKKRWVNGSLGRIESCHHAGTDKEFLRIHLHDTNKTVAVAPFMWEVYKFAVEDDTLTSESAGSFTQYPFRLAWAVTIHKSQGKTFDKVVIDMGIRAFASGQAYVALSRCTSFEGLKLSVPLKKQHIKTDPSIHKFLNNQAYKSAEKKLPFQKKISILQEAMTTQSSLEMTYLKADGTKFTKKMTPLKVGEATYQGKRFPGVLARCLSQKEDQLYNASRILDLKKAKSS